MEANYGGRLDYLTDEMCQINTRVGCIAHRQAHLGGFLASPSPSPKALLMRMMILVMMIRMILALPVLAR